MGDGCLSYFQAYVNGGPKYFVHIAGDSRNDFKFFTHIISLIHKLFGLNVRMRKRTNFNGIEIGFSSKSLFALLRNLGFPVGKKRHITIPGAFLQNHLWPHVVRGIFDTDGCLVFSKQHRNLAYYPRIEITNSSLELIKQLHNLLLGSEFNCSYRWAGKQSWKLEVAGAQNLEKWIRKIGFNNPRHVQKYLIWKQLGYYPCSRGSSAGREVSVGCFA